MPPRPPAETLASIMSTPPITVEADAPLLEALRTMVRNDIGAVLVTEAGRVTGIVTERDIVKAVARRDPQVLERRVADLAPDRDLITAPPGASPVGALELMSANDVRRIPVAERGGGVVGLVTEGDVVAWLLDRPEVVLEMLSRTQPAVARDALVALVREMQLRPTV